MKFSDIKVAHVYNVIFDDVRENEFNGTHLSVVLKINNDMRTVIVMPLTSVQNGVGTNKIKIDVIALPPSLALYPSYAVYNQIRTLNASRFMQIKNDDRKPINVNISDETYMNLLNLGISDLVFAANSDKKIEIFKRLYIEEKVKKAKILAYNINKKNLNENQILKIKEEIYSLVCDEEIKFTQNEINHQLDKIIKNAINDNLLELR